jgi:hypothetical protein
MSEHEEQVALIKWTQVMAAEVPELDLIYACPNGGHRHISVAKELKLEGVKAGIPDLFLPVARQGYHGLYIELKRVKTAKIRPQMSDHQKIWARKLRQQGYRVVCCFGAKAAIGELIKYLGLN